VISLGKLVCPLKPTSISSGKENAKEVFGQFRTVELRNSARFVQSAHSDRAQLTGLFLLSQEGGALGFFCYSLRLIGSALGNSTLCS
jgi:hypothetical protein